MRDIGLVLKAANTNEYSIGASVLSETKCTRGNALMLWLQMFFAACLLGATAVCIGQTAPPARPPQAQEALNRGLQMAQRQQWDLAIRYFRTAHELAPADPALLLNLALAHDKAGQHEIAASAWYRAFLAAAPGADTAAQVEKRVTDLEIDLEIQYRKLVEAAGRVAARLPSERESSQVWAHVALAQAQAGDAAQAQQSITRVRRPSAAAWVLAQIAALYANSGEVDLAASVISTMPAGKPRAWAQAELAVGQAKRGQFANAFTTANAVDQQDERAWAYAWLTVLQARRGDLKTAAESLERVPRERTALQAVALAYVGAAVAGGGTWKGRGSADVLSESGKLLASVTDSAELGDATAHVARARAEAGDFSGAEQLAAQLGNNSKRYTALRAIALKRGDTQQAKMYHWISLALLAEGLAVDGDIGALSSTAQDKAPAATGVAVAQAAEVRGRFLQSFRQFR